MEDEMEKNYVMRRKRAALTKQKLLDASVRLINERGYNNTTIDDICAECGISKGAFYHHFNSKIDIVSGLEAQVSSRLEEELIGRHDIDISEKLVIFLKGLMKGVEDSGLEFVRQRSIYNISGEYTKTAGDGSYTVSSRNFEKKLILEAVADGILLADIPADDIVEIISTFMSGLITSWVMFNDSFSITERAETYGKQLIDGILSPYKTI